MEKGATLTLSLPCNNKKLPILLEASAIENGSGGEFCRKQFVSKQSINLYYTYLMVFAVV